MKYLLLVLVATFLSASEVQITADKFMANEVKLVSTFRGHVHVTKGSDDLKADKIVIDFNKDKKPIKYTATGNAKANMTLNKKKYFASGNVLIYQPKLARYTIEKNAFLHELGTDKKVYGDVIQVDQNKGYHEVGSKENEPVKFIFKIEDKKK